MSALTILLLELELEFDSEPPPHADKPNTNRIDKNNLVI